MLKQTLLSPPLPGSLIAGCDHTTVPMVSPRHLTNASHAPQGSVHHQQFPTQTCTSKLPCSASWFAWVILGRLGVVRNLWSFQKVGFVLGTNLGSLSVGIGLQKRHKGSLYCFKSSLPPQVMHGVTGPNPAPSALQFIEISLRFQQLVIYFQCCQECSS